MSNREAESTVGEEPEESKRWSNVLETFKERLGKENIPGAMIRPMLRTTEERAEVTDIEDSKEGEINWTYEETLAELRRISEPLVLPSSDQEDLEEHSISSDEESEWETTLPSIEDLPDLEQGPEPVYIRSSPIPSESDLEFECELWRWQIS